MKVDEWQVGREDRWRTGREIKMEERQRNGRGPWRRWRTGRKKGRKKTSNNERWRICEVKIHLKDELCEERGCMG